MNEFYTTSEVKFVSLDEWLQEFELYKKLVNIVFFKRFKKMKSFQTWKRIVKRQKFISASNQLMEDSCIFSVGNPKMRDSFCQVQSLVGRLTDMGITEILPRKTYNIKDFFARQQSLILDFNTNFCNFRENVCQLVLDTCKSTFHENGFNYDDYSFELAFFDRSSAASTSFGSNIQQPRKMTFMEQVNKRKVCEKLVQFIRLIDYMLRWILHCIACNSLIAIHKALLSRAKKVSSAVAGVSEKKKAKEEKDMEEQDEIPVFTCLVSVLDREISISPSYNTFEDGFKNLLSKLNEAIRSIPLLGNDRAFHPFTRPILYGKVIQVYKPIPSTAEAFLLQGHDIISQQILRDINGCVQDGFAVCKLEMEPYVETAREFCQVDSSPDGGGLVDVETDVDSLKSKLSNLTDQQHLAKNIKDSQIVALFRADFRPMKRVVLPNISKTIVRMQDALPKLGREKMDNFNEDCKAIKELIDFELKTTEDYVNNMDIGQKLQDR